MQQNHTLTSKQRAALRGVAAALSPTLQIGKEGITDNLVKQVSDILTARELMKIRVLETAPLTARAACDVLCERLLAQPVQVIGGCLVVYRENPEKRQLAALL